MEENLLANILNIRLDEYGLTLSHEKPVFLKWW